MVHFSLEKTLSQHYATLSKGDTIHVHTSGPPKRTFELNVLDCTPDQVINIIDTNLSVEFAPPLHVIPPPIDLKPGEILSSQKVSSNAYLYYRIVLSDSESLSKTLVIEVEPIQGDPDLYVDQKVSRPTQWEHTWSSTERDGENVTIVPTDEKRDVKIPRFYIGVRGYQVDTEFKIVYHLEEEEEKNNQQDKGRKLKLSALRLSRDESGGLKDHRLCENCQHWVRNEHYERHAAFCPRSNYLCRVCKAVMRVEEKANHVHCEKCGKAMGKNDLAKHLDLVHSLVPSLFFSFTCFFFVMNSFFFFFFFLVA